MELKEFSNILDKEALMQVSKFIIIISYSDCNFSNLITINWSGAKYIFDTLSLLL